jgi:chromosome segregation ATPase
VKPGYEAQRAHDALLQVMPAGSVHEPCDLCPDPIKKEVAQVADADRTYTEVEHLALMADAVTRETASLTEAKESAETKISDLTARVDVLEAEKAALETKVSEAETAFDDYQTELERLAAIETAKQERVEAVKAANESLPESYFTEERIQRWAEMETASFDAFIADITAVAVSSEVKETAAFSGGESPTEASKVTVGRIFAARRGEKN